MAIKIPKKRGRPVGSKNKSKATEAPKVKLRSEAEVLAGLMRRFDILSMLTQGAIKGTIPSSVVTGAPGIGKSYTAKRALSTSGAKHAVIGGGISGPGLFSLAWDHREPGQVILIDDGDGVFEDQDTLNLLKGMCDSTADRVISWYKEASWLKEAGIDRTFTYRGSIMFLSNLDFQGIVDNPSTNRKFKAHFEALMSRSMYLDMQLHQRREVAIWIKHLCTKGKLFQMHDVDLKVGDRILTFLDRYHSDLRELSIRTLTAKLFPLAKTSPTGWEPLAEELLLKPGSR